MKKGVEVGHIGCKIPAALKRRIDALSEEKGCRIEWIVTTALGNYCDLIELEDRIARPSKMRAAAIYIGQHFRKRDPTRFMKFSEAVDLLGNSGGSTVAGSQEGGRSGGELRG